MPRFLCSGDGHLGAGADLGREPGERLDEQELALGRLHDLAVELGVPLLWAGDAWERRRPTPAEILAFKRPLLGLDVLGVAGNHDVEAWQRPTGYDLLDFSITAQPDVVKFDDAIVCRLPWAPASHLVALEAGGDRDELNRRLAVGLVEVARGLFVTAQEIRHSHPEWPVILLGHWSVGGATTPTGAPTDLFREPVIDLGELDAIGFDAMVFGHIHRPQMLGERGFYVGSPMPLNFGETGCDHVAWLLDVEPGKFSAFQIPIESTPLKSYVLQAREVGPGVGVDVPLDYDDAIVKIKIHATEEQARRLDVAAIKRALTEPTREIASGPAPRARKVSAIQVEIDRPDVARGVTLDETLDDVEAFTRWLEVSGVPFDTDAWGDLLEEHQAYLAKAAA